MDRTVAVRSHEPQAPAPAHLRLAEVIDEESEGDGPTRMFTTEPSYRGPGVDASDTTLAPNPAPGAPVGRSTSIIELIDDAVIEVLEGRLDLDVDALPQRPEHTVAAAHVPRTPRSDAGGTTPRGHVPRAPIDGGGTVAVAMPVLRTPEGVAKPEGTQVVERPVLRTPEGVAKPEGTQVVERPVLRTPEGVAKPEGTQVVERPVLRTPEPGAPVVEPTMQRAPAPVVSAPPLGVPMPVVKESTATLPVTGARVVIAGRYLVGGDEGASLDHRLGGSWVLSRSKSSPFADDPYVDAQHGALSFRPDGVAIEDFDSTNGVFVRVRGRVALRSGDVLRCGEELLRYTALKNGSQPGRAPVLGSPDPGYWARIDVMLTLDDNAASYPVDEDEASFGQTDGHVQFPDDPYLGELHCRIRKTDRGATLEDLGSAYGTWLRLRSGDVVPYGAELLVGQTRLRIEAI
ncbi:MAG: FHA domain-containing protein [Nannocystaceae bacterium]|nr:FHA domain-containing protein [Nannocystaceae bacterium]